MRYLCVSIVLIATAIMAVSLCLYHSSLVAMRSQSYNGQDYRHPVYNASLAMMFLFLLGYIGIAILIATIQYRSGSTLLVCAILLCSAVFALCMVRTVQRLSATIANKTSEIILAMVNAMEAKDYYTKGHSVHVMQLCMLIYAYLPPELKCTVDPVLLRDAALLHDVGKIAMPDNILNKPGRLTSQEMEVVRQHPLKGTNILEKTSYKQVADWVLYHHERIDGSGYYRLPGEQIPLEARIMAVADTFSALYTDRIYRTHLPFDEAIHILKDASGTQLDPVLVDIFCGIGQPEVDAASVLDLN